MSYSLYFILFNIINRGAFVKKSINKRVLAEGNWLIDNKITIRDVAEYFNISKSTVHKDLKEKLPLIDCNLSKQVNERLKDNFSNRHLRGGEKTRQKYQKLK